jgi:hypothetical protein
MPMSSESQNHTHHIELLKRIQQFVIVSHPRPVVLLAVRSAVAIGIR